MLGTVNQIATSVGVFLVYALPFFLDYKWLAIFGGVNAAATMIFMTFMPETPRWWWLLFWLKFWAEEA